MEQNAPWPDRVRLAARQARGRAVAPRQGRHRRMDWLASAAAALIVAACASSGSDSSGSTPSRAAAPAPGMADPGSALNHCRARAARLPRSRTSADRQEAKMAQLHPALDPPAMARTGRFFL